MCPLNNQSNQPLDLKKEHDALPMIGFNKCFIGQQEEI